MIGALALGMALAWGQTSALAADARSSPEDRARFVSITGKMEAAPLDAGLREDRNWALSWLVDAPDVSVMACLGTLGVEQSYRYSAEVTFQYMFAMAALVIEDPQAASTEDAKQLAGAQGALKAYRAILVNDPKATSSALERLQAAEAKGELPALVRKGFATCKAAG
ncbi:MAG: hypothetical protein QM608_15695 [Caulobacter sp.]